jgi:hypothetical protein
MMDITYSPVPSYPINKKPVRALLQELGFDVSDWSFTKDGEVIENPNDNIGRNTSWSFVGNKDEPIVLCVWYEHVDWSAVPAFYRGNESEYQQRLIDLAGTKKGSEGTGRLKNKIKRAREFQRAVFEAYRSQRAIKMILVGGEEVSIEESAEKASIVKVRGLDNATWYVHEYDGMSGDFLIVREVPPAIASEDTPDLSEDISRNLAFQGFLAKLSETERDAIIKTRVGQGEFRDRLIERWKGCSVTGCGLQSVLIASHIKPWKYCETTAERLGAANGLLLTPNLDKLFDRGLISFDENFRIMFSRQLPSGFAQMLNVNKQMKIRDGHTDMAPYLSFHRQYIFVDGGQSSSVSEAS